MSSPSLSSLLRQAAQAAAGGQQYPAGTLYVVATPIGNLADLSLRAIHVLSLMDAIACEDTRHTATLTHHLGLSPALIAVHTHNEREAAERVIARLGQGQRVACVSDAGTPAVSDPGARLVDAVVRAGYRVCPIPGPSAVATAVSVAGAVDAPGAAGGFCFAGFLPAHGQARARAIAHLADAPGMQVLFESPQRLADLLTSLVRSAPQRRVTVCRELSKQFEDVSTDSAESLQGWWATHPARGKGEVVVVLHPQAVANDPLAQADPTLRALLRELPLRQAVALCVELTGAPRKQLYARALALRGDDDSDSDGADEPADGTEDDPRG